MCIRDTATQAEYDNWSKYDYPVSKSKKTDDDDDDSKNDKVGEETYLMMTGKNSEYYTPVERRNIEMSGIVGYFLKNVICDGQFYEEFIVSKYGIEYIREVKH